MKDVRDSDLCRKISLINGVRLHTFEYTVPSYYDLVKENKIRCIIMYFDPESDAIDKNRISARINDEIPAELSFELYGTVRMILREEPGKAKFMQLGEGDAVTELLMETDLISKMGKILPEFQVHQILQIEAERNGIIGLPFEFCEITTIVSLKRLPTMTTSVLPIVISDDSVIVISDDDDK